MTCSTSSDITRLDKASHPLGFPHVSKIEVITILNLDLYPRFPIVTQSQSFYGAHWYLRADETSVYSGDYEYPPFQNYPREFGSPNKTYGIRLYL